MILNKCSQHFNILLINLFLKIYEIKFNNNYINQ